MMAVETAVKKIPELILITDDDPGIREVFQALLRIRGFQVLVADDGPAALELYREHRQDVAAVVTDMRMPRMHGSELIRQLRAIDQSVKIVGMTGYFGFDEANVPQNVAVLRKPLAGVELLAALKRVGVVRPDSEL